MDSPGNALNSPTVHQVAELSRWTTICGRNIRKSLLGSLQVVDLAEGEFLLLWMCSQREDQEVSQAEISACVGVSTAQLSVMADRLRQRELILSVRSQKDRRRQHLALTPSGRQLLQRAMDALKTTANLVQQTFTDKQRDLAIDFLKRASTLFEQLPGKLGHGTDPAASSRREAA